MSTLTKPHLIIIGGPNGAGKSTSSAKFLQPYKIKAFDFDHEFYTTWRKFNYDPVIEQGVRNNVSDRFTEHLNEAYKNKKSVAFETNFSDLAILEHVQKAKEHSFKTRLVFIGLSSTKLAQQRVDHRVKNNGHFVDPHTINNRFAKGLENLNNHYNKFDEIAIYDSKKDFTAKLSIYSTDKGLAQIHNPSFAKHIPNINKELKKKIDNPNKGLNF